MSEKKLEIIPKEIEQNLKDFVFKKGFYGTFTAKVEDGRLVLFDITRRSIFYERVKKQNII